MVLHSIAHEFIHGDRYAVQINPVRVLHSIAHEFIRGDICAVQINPIRVSYSEFVAGDNILKISIPQYKTPLGFV